jgi:hypothetical protein
MVTKIGENATFLRLVVEKDFLKTIQDYRFAARHNSLSEAIRVLITRGLIAEGCIKPAEGVTLEPPDPSRWFPQIKDDKLLGWFRDGEIKKDQEKRQKHFWKAPSRGSQS